MLNSLTYCDFEFLEHIEMLLQQSREDCLSVEEDAILGNIRSYLKRTKIVLPESLESYASGGKSDWQKKEFRAAILRGFTNEDKKRRYSTYSESTAGMYDEANPNCLGAIVLSRHRDDRLIDHGVLNISSSDILSSGYLFDQNNVAVDEGYEVRWKPWIDRCLPNKAYNSLLIIDNYSAKFKKNNLFPIIRALLPKQCSKTFHLAIVCYAKNNVNEQGFEFNEDNLERYVCSRYNYEIDSVVIKLNSALGQAEHGVFHDRIIITNYSRISAGAGLDQIQSKDSTEASNLTEYIGTYPDFINSGEEFLFKNLAKFFKNRALIDNIKRNHKESIYNNPIIKQYMSTYEYLKDVVINYAKSIKIEGLIDSSLLCGDSFSFGYDELNHELTVQDNNSPDNRIKVRQDKIFANSGKNGEHNDFINALRFLPNYQYVVDDIYFYQTDAYGRVIKVTVELSNEMILNKQQEIPTPYKDKKGAFGNDESSHIIAKSFGGSSESINWISMPKEVNKGFYRSAEIIVSQWIEEGSKVLITISLEYERNDYLSLRPNTIFYTAEDKGNSDRRFSLTIPNISIVGNAVAIHSTRLL